MDVFRSCVAKRTRNQHQKAEEELLVQYRRNFSNIEKTTGTSPVQEAPLPRKAKMSEEEKVMRKKKGDGSSKKHSKIGRSKVNYSESSSSDFEFLPSKENSSEEQFRKKRRVFSEKSGKRRSKSVAKRLSKDNYCEGSSSDFEFLPSKENSSEEQFRKKRRIFNEKSGKRRSKSVAKRLSKDNYCEGSSSDFEFLPLGKPQFILIDDETQLPSQRRDPNDANHDKGRHKDIRVPSRSYSVSSGSEKGDDLGNSGSKSSRGRQGEIGGPNMLCLDSSSEEEDDGEFDNSISHGDENNDQGRNEDETSSESTTSEEDDDSDFDDKDYDEEAESVNSSDSDSEDPSHSGEDDLDERAETVNKKRKPAKDHESRKGKGKAVLEDKTYRDEEVDRRRIGKLRRRQVFESRKKKHEPDAPSDNDHFEEKSSREIGIDVSKRKNGESKFFDAPTDNDSFEKKSSRESGRDGHEKSKRKDSESQKFDFINILSESIWEKCDALEEKLPQEKEKDHHQKAQLSYKFRFDDDDDPATPEKTEEEKRVEDLFLDLAMGWTEDDIGATKSSEDDNVAAAAKETTQMERCELGRHSLILNDQLGLVCQYCGVVQEEMRHILPDMKPPTRRRYEQFDPHNDKCSTYGFEFGDSSSGDHNPLSDIEGPVLNLIPTIYRRQMYHHQLEGFQFLWKNIGGAASIEEIKTPLSDDGTGCIVSHAPGTGKSYLTIVFLLTFMKVHPTCRPMILAPVTMLRAWADELKRWNISIPFHNLNDPELSGQENAVAATVIQRVNSSNRDRKSDRDYKRMVKLYSWKKDRSILGIGYKMFEKLAGEHRKGEHVEKFRKILLEVPSILILDEGHTPRNQKSLLWKALTKAKTSRRIILSGTPFQNNFHELYNTFCLVNSQFAEQLSIETCTRRGPKWKLPGKGKWTSLIDLIHKNADNSVEELRAMMDPFVHVHKGAILQENLPGLRNTLVVIKPTDLQKQLLEKIPDNVFEEVHLVSLVSVHPSLVAHLEAFSDHKRILEELTSPEAGVKTQFVIEIVRLSMARGEKVLIFSEFLDPLNFLMKKLTSYFSWEEGKQVLSMDGKLNDKLRQLVIHSLNDPNSESRVLLASTKACCEGINLVGASRVVLLDVVWNHSVERQAISRAYRLGQKKFVYVYHLITAGTIEIKKYQKQTNKDRISELVFSSPGGHNSKSEVSGIVSGDKILDAIYEKLPQIFHAIRDQPKESNVFENFNFIM